MKRALYLGLFLGPILLLIGTSTAVAETFAYGTCNANFFRLSLEDASATSIPCSVTHLQLAFAPNGTLYAVSRNTDALYRFTDPANGELEFLADVPMDASGGDTTVSPDGKGVYFTLGWQSTQMFRYDIEDSTLVSLGHITGADNDFYGLAFSKDGTLYGTTGTSGGDKRLYVIDLATLQATAVGPPLFGTTMHPEGSAGSLDFAPDGTLCAGIEPIDASLPGSQVYISTIDLHTGIATIDYSKLITGLDSIAIIPEPTTIFLLGFGGLLLSRNYRE
jgi:WD40 repeat protein